MKKSFANPAYWLLFMCALCAVTPLLLSSKHVDVISKANATSAPWPRSLHGRELIPLELTAREQVFLSGFPGAVRRFSDGEREVVIRWVTQATRRLHPAADCYRALGFKIDNVTIVRDAGGLEKRCFIAKSDNEALRVCEHIKERTGQQSWTDVSAWYWSATLRGSSGPWWVVTTAERTTSPLD